MPFHGLHLLLFALAYGVFLEVVASAFSRRRMGDAIQAAREGQPDTAKGRTRASCVKVVIFSLPLFILGLFFVR